MFELIRIQYLPLAPKATPPHLLVAQTASVAIGQILAPPMVPLLHGDLRSSCEEVQRAFQPAVESALEQSLRYPSRFSSEELLPLHLTWVWWILGQSVLRVHPWFAHQHCQLASARCPALVCASGLPPAA